MSKRACLCGAAALILAVVVACGSAQDGQPAESSPRVWAPDVMEALTAYQAGDYEIARGLCRRLLMAESTRRVRHDASVIEALCVLRAAGRAERVTGRGMLAQLAADDPSLEDDPECMLAYGVALVGLSETAEGLYSIAGAVDGFAACGQTSRRVAGLVVLAEAWARHTEWEVTPERFKVQRPMSVESADALRRARIEEVRSRVAALPAHGDALDRIDLVLARHMLKTEATEDAGLAVLARLAERRPLTSPPAEAAMLLAEQHAARGELGAAVGLYRRVSGEWSGRLAREADERVAGIIRAQIVVECPASVPSGQAAALRVRTRGLDEVVLEVRRVDVDQWLGSLQTRGSAAHLPVSGAVALAREWVTASDEFEWWDSGDVDADLEVSAAPGAYVVLARGRGADGRVIQTKKLLVVSDLEVVCFTGRRDVLLWAARTPADGGETGRVRFWMKRSFMATEVELAGGVARFALPNEAHVMRDKEWVCLVEMGSHVAVCRGRLRRADDEPRASAVLLGGPPAVEMDSPACFAGLVLDGGAGEGSVALRVVDTNEMLVAEREIDLLPGGVFGAEMAYTPAEEKRHMRGGLRQSGRALELLATRPVVVVPAADSGSFRVRIDVPTNLAADARELSGTVHVEYPWGVAPMEASVECHFTALLLPESGGEKPHAGQLVIEGGLTDGLGRVPFVVQLEEFGLGSGPLRIAVDVRAWDWGDRVGRVRAEVLVGAAGRQSWLIHEPAEVPAGSAVRFEAGWFDPQGAVVPELPEFVVHGGDAGGVVARLRPRLGEHGVESEPWRPAFPGNYEVIAELAGLDGDVIRLVDAVTVGAASDSDVGVGPMCRAYFEEADGRRFVRVELRGDHAGPVLAVLEDGEPLVCGGLDELHGAAEVLLPCDRTLGAGLRVVVVGGGDGGVEVLCAGAVEPGPDQMLEVDAEVVDPQVWPGSRAVVRVDCRRGAGAATEVGLLARLIRAPGLSGGGADASAGEKSPVADGRWAYVDSSADGRLAVSGTVAEGNRVARQVALEGETLWCMALSGGAEPVEIAMPMPAEPGLYKLIVVGRGADGAVGVDAVKLDSRRGLAVAVDVAQRMTPGDRTTVLVSVRNGDRQAAEASLRVDVGAGLDVLTSSEEGPITIAIPAGGQASWAVEVQAERVGPGAVVVEIEDGDRRWGGRGEYVIESTEQAADGGCAGFVRRLFVRSRKDGCVGHEHSGGSHARWRWVELGAGELLHPGQFVRVEETLTLERPLAGVTWSLRVPAVCVVVKEDPRSGRAIGTRRPGRSDELRYRVGSLNAGRHAYEYYLTAVRGGECEFAAPVLEVGERRLAVADEGTRLSVSAGGSDSGG